MFTRIILFVVLAISFQVIGYADYPEKNIWRNLYYKGTPLFWEDGINLSRKNLRGVKLDFDLDNQDGVEEPDILKNIDFSWSDMSNAHLEYGVFVNCSFRGTDLSRTYMIGVQFENCDFTDAMINGSVAGFLTKEELQTTASYKKKNFSYAMLPSDLSDIDFSDFYMQGASFMFSNVRGCKFDNTVIAGSHIHTSLTKEQLLSTKDFRERKVLGVRLIGVDFSDADLSRTNFTDCEFSCNVKNADFTDAVISGCSFSSKNLTITLSQIKSTWNYKTGNMAGVVLPKELQEQLDKEKEEKETEK